jgi:hypothetical protein
MHLGVARSHGSGHGTRIPPFHLGEWWLGQVSDRCRQGVSVGAKVPSGRTPDYMILLVHLGCNGLCKIKFRIPDQGNVIVRRLFSFSVSACLQTSGMQKNFASMHRIIQMD